ncbi:MAG: hypothetical protein ACJ77I_13580 [Chloroflexota bacterium]
MTHNAAVVERFLAWLGRSVMRILIAGASGYVGGRLVPLLTARGQELTR